MAPSVDATVEDCKAVRRDSSLFFGSFASFPRPQFKAECICHALMIQPVIVLSTALGLRSLRDWIRSSTARAWRACRARSASFMVLPFRIIGRIVPTRWLR